MLLLLSALSAAATGAAAAFAVPRRHRPPPPVRLKHITQGDVPSEPRYDRYLVGLAILLEPARQYGSREIVTPS